MRRTAKKAKKLTVILSRLMTSERKPSRKKEEC